MIINMVLILASLLAFSKLLSMHENNLVSINYCGIKKTFDNNSLRVFKYMRLILFLLCSFECQIFHNYNIYSFIVGLILIGSGILLRTCAINALGQFWSFNVVLFNNHKYITKGVYRYLNHPAYLGNIYLVGLFLLFNSQITSLISLIFMTIFYCYRSSLEDKILKPWKEIHEKLEILPRYIKTSL